MGVSRVAMAETITLPATSLAMVSLTLSVLAWEARSSTADNKTNRQAPIYTVWCHDKG